MQLHKDHDILKMGKRARKAIEAAELHFRADFAEALLSNRKPRKRNPEEASPAADAFLRLVGKIDDDKREKLIESLMSADLLTRKITKEDRKQLKSWINPKAKTPMSDRSGFPKYLAKHFAPEKDLEDRRYLGEWTYEVLRDFYPNMPENDGRPEDAEPGTPEPDPGPSTPTPTPQPVPGSIQYNRLRFVVDEVECVNPTRELGRDEINYSGIATEGPLADFMQPSAVGSTRLGIRNAGQFNDGDTIDESVRGPMHVYDLAGQTLPRLFIIHLTMAEIDSGGFETYMIDFNRDLTAELTSMWQEALVYVGLNTLAGGLVGAAASALGVAIGAAIGAAVGVVVVGIFFPSNDDIFEHRSVVLTLEPDPLQHPPFNGNPVSEQRIARMRRDLGLLDAMYDITYHWELTGGTVVPGPVDQDPPPSAT